MSVTKFKKAYYGKPEKIPKEFESILDRMEDSHVLFPSDHLQTLREKNWDKACEQIAGISEMYTNVCSKDFTVDDFDLCFELPISMLVSNQDVFSELVKANIRECDIKKYPYKNRFVDAMSEKDKGYINANYTLCDMAKSQFLQENKSKLLETILKNLPKDDIYSLIVDSSSFSPNREDFHINNYAIVTLSLINDLSYFNYYVPFVANVWLRAKKFKDPWCNAIFVVYAARSEIINKYNCFKESFNYIECRKKYMDEFELVNNEEFFKEVAEDILCDEDFWGETMHYLTDINISSSYILYNLSPNYGINALKKASKLSQKAVKELIIKTLKTCILCLPQETRRAMKYYEHNDTSKVVVRNIDIFMSFFALAFYIALMDYQIKEKPLEFLKDNSKEEKLNDELVKLKSNLASEIAQYKSKQNFLDIEINSKSELIENQKQMINEKDKQIKKLEDELKRLKAEKKELVALREFVWNMSEENYVTEGQTFSKDIFNKKVFVLGGHPSLIKKMKSEFPDLTYVSVEQVNYNFSAVTNYDLAVIVTGCLSHSLYEKFLSDTKGDVEMFYLNGIRNFETAKQQIGEKLEKLA